MPRAWNPWPAPHWTEKHSGGKKTTRLVGMGPGRVHVLVNLHDWQSRAIYLYNLVTEAVERLDSPPRDVWDQYCIAGIEIPHMPKTPVTDVTAWIEYGQKQAAHHRLTLGE